MLSSAHRHRHSRRAHDFTTIINLLMATPSFKPSNAKSFPLSADFHVLFPRFLKKSPLSIGAWAQFSHGQDGSAVVFLRLAGAFCLRFRPRLRCTWCRTGRCMRTPCFLLNAFRTYGSLWSGITAVFITGAISAIYSSSVDI